MSRYPALPSSKLPADLKPWGEDYDEFLLHLALDDKKSQVFQFSTDDGALIGPYPILIASKEIGKYMQNIQTGLKDRKDPSPEVRVVSIFAVAARFNASFAKYSYTEVGKKIAGLSDEQVVALRKGKKPQGLSEAASVAWDMANFLVNEKGPLPESLFNAAEKVLGREGALNAVHYTGFYCHICILENFADVPYPPGVSDL